MNDPRNLSPEQRLAEGFAQHAVRWARQRAAPAETLTVLREGAYLASLATASGHVCTHIDDIRMGDTAHDSIAVRAQLVASGIVGTPGAPGNLPLVLDANGRLYLHRYFDYERRLASRLMASTAAPANAAADARVAVRLNELFAANKAALDERIDWQKIAAALAYAGRLTIISGGPGTGKTTTVVNLLACLLADNPDCRIALAAPTGKAAARVLEAIRRRAATMLPDLQARLPSEAFTVHRLLGVTREPGQFRHHAGNPLAIDALVVDEASMLDLALATKLVEAVPTSARIVLLGDKDQLAAVESGAVFSELCADPTLSSDCISRIAALTGIAAERVVTAAPLAPTPLHDRVVWFTANFRFAKGSGIGRLAHDINQGDAALALAWMRAEEDPGVRWIEDGGMTPAQSALQVVDDGFADYRDAVRRDVANRAAIFASFGRFRVLCAEREGPRGAAAINARVNRRFRQASDDPIASGARSEWYAGRPVMVLRNDYVLKLFNGDVGIALPDPSGALMVFFPDGDAGFRAIAPARLPEHGTAFASTVHKAQGSEFDAVLVLLPAQPARVATRELLYTAVTRARDRVTLVGSAEVLAKAMASPTQRHTGLIARLREAG